MATQAAFGFKLHTGWAVLVAISGSPGDVQLHFRRRIELLPADGAIPRFVYHAASEQPMEKARALVARAKKTTARIAKLAVQEALTELDPRGVTVHVCGILSGSTSVPDDLSAIVGSHPLIHAAEGVLFQHAVASACEDHGLTVVEAPERVIWARAAVAWRVEEPELRTHINGMRKSLGPPWSADHKAATAMALLALKSRK